MKIRKKVSEIELQGSTKQIEWANVIRDKRASEIEKMGYSGVLKIIRPHVTQEVLDQIGCSTERDILCMAHWIVWRLFAVNTCFQWIAERTTTTEDLIESIGRKALKDWRDTSPFNK